MHSELYYITAFKSIISFLLALKERYLISPKFLPYSELSLKVYEKCL